MIFEDRTEAGRKLAQRLVKYINKNPIILALPRGGVPVGFEIAKKLNASLDVLVVRKLGAPFQVEFGIGAIAPGNIKILDEVAIKNLGLSQEEIEEIEKQERAELNRRIREYRGTDSMLDIEGKIVILVDDGLATGISAKAAIKAVLKQEPKKLIIAVPVGAAEVVESIRSTLRLEDEIICLSTPDNFSAVGEWYKSFDQVSDEEVINLLKKSSLKKIRV